MKTATITQAKNGLSALIDQVKAGETILITDRGVPVARRTSPVAGGATDGDARVDRVVRAGFATRGTGDLSDHLRRGPASNPGGVSLVEILLEDRGSGR